MLITQIANGFGALPISPAGVGTRDLTLSILLRAEGADPQAATCVPLVVTASLLAWMSIGLILLVCTMVAGRKPRRSNAGGGRNPR